MKTFCTSLLILLLSPVVFAQAPITGKLVKIAIGTYENSAKIVGIIGSNISIEERSKTTSGSTQAESHSTTDIHFENSGYPNTLFLIIEADGIRYYCSQYARHTSDLHSGNWLVGGTVTLTIHADKAEIRSSEGYIAKTTILKKEQIYP